MIVLDEWWAPPNSEAVSSAVKFNDFAKRVQMDALF